MKKSMIFLTSLMLFAGTANATMIEDAEDNTTAGWSVYDNSPAGATITNIDDGTGNRVIELKGDGLRNGYMLGFWGQNGFDEMGTNLSWKMDMQGKFSVYVVLRTHDENGDTGNRYLWYSSSKTAEDGTLPGERYIRYAGITPDENNTISRDLEADLHNYLEDLDITYVKAFLVRGSGTIDDIELN